MESAKQPFSRSSFNRNTKPVDKVTEFGWKIVDEPGVPYLAKKTELLIDTSYQRDVSPVRIRKIAANWSWGACGSLIVSERPDRALFVVDGHHRLEAAHLRSDIEELPCIVFRYGTLTEEALAFFRVNCGRGPVAMFDRFRSLIAAEDTSAIAAEQILKDTGYKFTKTSEHYGVRCIGAFMDALAKDRSTLVKVWPLIAKLHGGLVVKIRPFRALMHIAKYGSEDITVQPWREKVFKAGLHKITENIDRQASLYSRGSVKLYAEAALVVINKGVPVKKRIELLDEADKEAARSGTGG